MMQLTRTTIADRRSTHEEFGYYVMIIEKIENNVTPNPDISIESSKALIEGVCKTITLALDGSTTEKAFQKIDFSTLFKETCANLDKHEPLEIDFALRTATMISRLSELRNERGDISHGRPVPKTQVSSTKCAKMVMGVTDSIVAYLLSAFFDIDLSYKDQIEYEKNLAFNDFLDENSSLEGISYSKALFAQDVIAYEEQLQDFLVADMEQEGVSR